MILPGSAAFATIGARALGAALLLAALCVLSAATPTPAWPQHQEHTAARALAVGHPAVPFELRALDGRSISLTGFRGKALVISFFASWCDPCREEMPLINTMAMSAKEKGYNVLGIAVEDGRAAVSQFAEEFRLGFPIALDLNSKVRRAYRIFGPPATFFIDPEGIVRDIVIGPLTADRERAGLRRAGVAP